MRNTRFDEFKEATARCEASKHEQNGDRDTSSGITALSLGDEQFKEDWRNRHVDEIGEKLLKETAELLQQRLLSLLGSRNSNTSGCTPP